MKRMDSSTQLMTIDKALGGMQESSEDAVQNNHAVNSAQNSSTEASNDTHEDPTHSPPEWGSTRLSQTACAESRANDEKAISDKTITEKAESENVVAESVSAHQVSTETEVVEKAAEEKVAIAKSTVANVAVEEVVAKTNYAYKRDDGAAGCTKGRWTVSNWKKSESTQDSWMVSVSNWFAEEMEDTGLQIAENSKFFGIASSIESFSNEGKELIIQQPETSYAAHTGQFGQIVGMLEQMLSHIQSDLWSRRGCLLTRSLWLPRMRV